MWIEVLLLESFAGLKQSTGKDFSLGGEVFFCIRHKVLLVFGLGNLHNLAFLVICSGKQAAQYPGVQKEPIWYIKGYYCQTLASIFIE